MSETRTRTLWSNPLRVPAVVTNGLLFGIGVYFEVHPQDRHDLWSAGGVAAAAVLNSAALTVTPEAHLRRFVRRLRRIATFANGILVVAAIFILAVEVLHDWRHASWHGLGLLAPPLLTLAALRREPALSDAAPPA